MQKIKFIIPSLFTLANIILGFFAILCAAESHFESAVYCLFAAGLCDMLDGRLARLLNASTKFGMELDSLSDMVSFGISPAVLIYLASIRDLGPLGAVISALYLSCGALRLARFNVGAGPLSNITFQGWPIPVGAGYLISFVMVRKSLSVGLIAFGTAFAAACMVSTIKVPKFRKGIGPPFAMLMVGMVFFIAFLWSPSALTWHLWNGWNFVMVISNYVYLTKQGYIGKNARPPEPQEAH
jgi:CDP-diacylglycerol--serine O-phosphatidyltransferase